MHLDGHDQLLGASAAPADLGAREALAVEEAAKRAGVSRSFLYEEMKAGRLRFLKAGRRRLIRPEALRAWLGSLEKSTA